MNGLAWFWFALAGAAFAGLVSVLSKSALKATDVFAALCLQSLLMLVTLVAATTVMGRWGQFRQMPRSAIGLLLLSGVAGGLAWTFGYQALQMSAISKAAQIDKLSTVIALLLAVLFLKERPTVTNWVGIALMVAGAVCVSISAATKK